LNPVNAHVPLAERRIFEKMGIAQENEKEIEPGTDAQ
jgi:hypothetical protein